MKSSIFALCLALAGFSTAHAGNAGPQAMPQAPTKVIAEVTTGGGLSQYPRRDSTKILSNGDVISETLRGEVSANPIVKKVATLEPDTLAALIKKINLIKKAPLVDPNPNSPGCMDAPVTAYLVTNSSGEEFPIQERASCKNYELQNMTEDASEVAQVLGGLSNLSFLIRQ